MSMTAIFRQSANSQGALWCRFQARTELSHILQASGIGRPCGIGVAESGIETALTDRRSGICLGIYRGRERQQEQSRKRRGVTGNRGINEGQPVGNHRLCREHVG
jgi:hypothetical protein